MNSFKQRLTALRDTGVAKAKKGMGAIEEALIDGPMERSRQMEESKTRRIVEDNFGGDRDLFDKHMATVKEADKTDVMTRMAGKGMSSFAEKLAQLRTKSSAPK